MHLSEIFWQYLRASLHPQQAACGVAVPLLMLLSTHLVVCVYVCVCVCVCAWYVYVNVCVWVWVSVFMCERVWEKVCENTCACVRVKMRYIPYRHMLGSSNIALHLFWKKNWGKWMEGLCRRSMEMRRRLFCFSLPHIYMYHIGKRDKPRPDICLIQNTHRYAVLIFTT